MSQFSELNLDHSREAALKLLAGFIQSCAGGKDLQVFLNEEQSKIVGENLALAYLKLYTTLRKGGKTQ